MTTPLDRDLAERLERLAAAVPVGAGGLDPVHRSAVVARQRVRMSWLTPLVALVVLALVAGALGLGSLGILNDGVSATTEHGDFELTLRSAKAAYMRGEPIEMTATLTYRGPERSVRISHASSPMTFGIVEPVHGMLLNGVWLQSCGSSELDRGVGLDRRFMKSFASPTELEPEALLFVREPRLVLPPGTWHPYVIAEFGLGGCGSPTISMRTEIAIDVMDGPTWIDPSRATLTPGPSPTPVPEDLAIHFVNLDPEPVEVAFRNRVIAFLACGQSTSIAVWELESAPLYTFIFRNGIRGNIGAATIDWGFPVGIVLRDRTVVSGPWPMPDAPTTDCDRDTRPSASPESSPQPSANVPVVGIDTVGPYTLELRSARAVYHVSDVIDVTGIFSYIGTNARNVAGLKVPLFSVREPVDGVELNQIVTMECNIATLTPGERITSPFRKGGGVSASDPDYERKLAYLRDPVFQLPVGTWHISVRGFFSEDTCGGDRQVQLSTTIEIEVIPD